jgi:hypothetical protein
MGVKTYEKRQEKSENTGWDLRELCNIRTHCKMLTMEIIGSGHGKSPEADCKTPESLVLNMVAFKTVWISRIVSADWSLMMQDRASYVPVLLIMLK